MKHLQSSEESLMIHEWMATCVDQLPGLVSLLLSFLKTVRMAELVDQPLRPLRLLHDALLVVLPDGPAELVVVHGRPVLPLAPEPGDADRVLDLEDALRPVQPPYAASVEMGLAQQLLQELPQVDVGVRSGAAGPSGAAAGRATLSVARLVAYLVWKERKTYF